MESLHLFCGQIIIIIINSLPSLLISHSSSLIFGEASQEITFDASGIDVQGDLIAGSETCLIQQYITITLHGERPSDAVTNPPPLTYKGIAVTGTLSLHGQRYFRTWTRLAATATVGDRVLVTQHPVNWEPGQEIVVTTTALKDSREWHQNEVHTVLVVDSSIEDGGSAVYLTDALQYKHIANDNYQAEVGLLTRRIKIQGAVDDSEPTDPDPLDCQTSRSRWGDDGAPCPGTELTGFGAHVIVHGGKGLPRRRGILSVWDRPTYWVAIPFTFTIWATAVKTATLEHRRYTALITAASPSMVPTWWMSRKMSPTT